MVTTQQAEAKVQETITLLEAKHGKLPQPLRITYKLTGRTAGRAMLSQNRINLNWTMLMMETDSMINTTVPHEVCHFFAWYKYRDNGHGVAWKGLMLDCGLSPDLYHSYELDKIMPGSYMNFSCGCGMKHTVGLVKGRKILNNPAKYWCKKCKGGLTKV